eukprot:5420862-Pleurochrysis_carterae.AAC.1
MLDEAPPPSLNQSAGSGICRSGDGESQESVNTLGAVASGEAGAEEFWSELSSSWYVPDSLDISPPSGSATAKAGALASERESIGGREGDGASAELEGGEGGGEGGRS